MSPSKREHFLVNGVVQPIVTDTHILGLYGPYRCLSNFHEEAFMFEGLPFLTSEGAYMSQKTLDPEYKEMFCALDGKTAKALGKEIPLRDDWDDIHRIHAMYRVLFAKFSQDTYSMGILMATGDRYIEETNWWGDVYWGRCGDHGYNHLGRILMTIRDFIKAQS